MDSLEERIWESLFKEAQQLLREGQSEPALKEFRGALNVAEKFGENDARLVQSLSGLALAHSVRREYDDAEPLFKRAASLTEKTQGADHPDLAKVLKHLALIYSTQRRFKPAEEALKRVMAIYERSSPNHPDLPVIREQYEKMRRSMTTESVVAKTVPTPITPITAKSANNGASEAKKAPTPKPPTAPVQPAQPAASASPAGHDPNTPRPGHGQKQPPEVAQSVSKAVNETQLMSFAMDTDRLIGTTIDNRYDVFERVADGGMSVIYKGRHKLMDREIAIKVLHGHLVSNERNIKRFKQEAKTSSLLTHQNIVGVRDFGVTADGLCYMVMDFVEGETLSAMITRMARIPSDRFVQILRQICDALAYAHEHKVLHRDLKPSNIMIETISGKDFAKIVDFGIAKIVSKDEEELSLTQTGETVGSPLYMSPEQCRGEALDARSDVYSLGCLAFKSLMGAPPFFGRSNVDVYMKHVSDPPPPFAQVCADAKVPPELEAIVMQALEKLPAQRQQSMLEMRKQLDALQF